MSKYIQNPITLKRRIDRKKVVQMHATVVSSARHKSITPIVVLHMPGESQEQAKKRMDAATGMIDYREKEYHRDAHAV